MERQNQQLVNLVTLFDSALSPAVARLAALDENQHSALIEHATASVIEAFGWYRIAVASGFIPIHESEIVLSTYAAYAGRNQNVQRWRDSFSNELLGWLEGRITSRRFFGHDDWRVEDGESVWPVLQTTATLAGDFASEGTSQCFVLALNFLSDHEWANLV